jgi:hypothetical protein
MRSHENSLNRRENSKMRTNSHCLRVRMKMNMNICDLFTQALHVKAIRGSNNGNYSSIFQFQSTIGRHINHLNSEQIYSFHHGKHNRQASNGRIDITITNLCPPRRLSKSVAMPNCVLGRKTQRFWLKSSWGKGKKPLWWQIVQGHNNGLREQSRRTE